MSRETAFVQAGVGGLFAAVSSFAYNHPRAKLMMLSLHLPLIYYAVNIYVKGHQVALLDHSKQTASLTKYDSLLLFAQVQRFFINVMVVRAAVCHISFWVNSTIEETNGERLFAFFLNKYLKTFEDIYAAR